MDIIYKALISSLSVILLFSTGFALTQAIADEIETNQYFDSATQLLAESHYHDEVVSFLINDAAEKGFKLTIEVYDSDTSHSKKYANATMEYSFEIPLFEISLARIKQKII